MPELTGFQGRQRLTVGRAAIDIPVERDQEEEIARRGQQIGQRVSRAGHGRLGHCDHPEGSQRRC